MKKLGFFGGSFNPPTYAHINVAKMSIEKFNLDAVYFVPVGNLYNKPSLIDENYRYKMLELICDDKIMVENIELGRKQTLNTLQAFELIENSKYIIFERNGSDSKSLLGTQEILKQNKNNFEFLDEKKYSNVSSGIIRELIQNGDYKECEKYTKPEIVQYIEENNLYL